MLYACARNYSHEISSRHDDSFKGTTLEALLDIMVFIELSPDRQVECLFNILNSREFHDCPDLECAVMLASRQFQAICERVISPYQANLLFKMKVSKDIIPKRCRDEVKLKYDIANRVR